MNRLLNDAITEGGVDVRDVAGVRWFGLAGERAMLELPSGRSTFESNW